MTRPGIFDLAGLAMRAGHPIIVVTNQSGIARGMFGEAEYQTVTEHMRTLFHQAGCALTDVLHCPYHADAVTERYRVADHPWRKPNPGMLLEARSRHDIDLSRSVLVGDRPSDLGAAAAAGLAAACIVGSPHREEDLPAVPVLKQAADVRDAAAWYESWLRER